MMVKKFLLFSLMLTLTLGAVVMADVVDAFNKHTVGGVVQAGTLKITPVGTDTGATSLGLVPTMSWAADDFGITSISKFNYGGAAAGYNIASTLQYDKKYRRISFFKCVPEKQPGTDEYGAYLLTIFDADSDGITDEGVIITDIKVDTISVAITGRILLREECTNQWYASSVTTISDNVAKSVTEAGLTWHAITESGDIETGIINGTLLPGGGVGIGNDTLTFGEAVAPPVAVDGGGVYLVDYPTIASHLNGFSWIGDASHGCDVPTEIVADWLGITSGLADNRVDLNTVVNSSSAGLIHSTGPSDDTPGWGGFNNSKIDSNWRIRWINNSVETIAGTALQLQGEANDPGTYLLTRFGQTLPGFNTIRTRFIRGNDRLQWMVRDASDGQWYVSDANDFRGDLDNVIDQWDMTTLNWAPIDSATSAAFSTDVFPDPNTFDLDALTYGTWATVMDGISIDGGGFYIKEATDQLEVNYISFNAIEPGVDNPPTVAISEFFDSPIYLQDYRDNGTVALTANATDENLPALSVLWEVISGPLSYSLTPDDALSISAQFGEVGTYELTCTVDDGVNDPVTSDPVTVEVIDNVAPVVNAGPATALVYLVDGGTLLLDGASVTDDGEPNGVAMVIGWDSGLDTSVSFDDASLVNATATFTEVGEFTLTLTADDTQASDDDSIVVTVEEKLLSTVTVGSIEDSFTAQNDPDANDGARAVVQVRVLTESWAREAYLKFDPGAISGNIRSAELTLQAFGGSRATIVSTDTVYAVTYGPSGEWFEGDGDTTVPTPDTTGVGITWNNDDLVWGDALGSLTSTFPGGTNHTFELSNVVFESDGKITLGVRSDISGTGGSWKSRENLAPQLTIYYDPQQAVEVIPVDEATEVHPGTSLVWQEAVGATAHEVYLGTTSGALGLVDTVPASAKISSDPNLFEWIPSAELDLGVEYFWRIDEVIGGVSIAGEEWSFTVAAVHPDIPTLVSPDDAAIEVACPVELIWNEGFSADSHDIYISDVAPLDVAGLIASGTQITGKDSGYRVPNLNLEATYYWTVVANGAGGPWPSEEVRSFTTAAFANLDNLDYDFLWVKDTAGFDANSVTILGEQVMRLTYDESDGVASVVSLTFPEARDLSGSTGRESLVFHLYGQGTNDPETLSISLSDGTAEASLVAVDYDEVAGDLTRPLYKSWDFMIHDLDDFAVDLSAVTKMKVTVGDGVGTESGEIYVDNLNVRTSRCIGQKVDGDIAMGDCIADANDLALIVRDWMWGETTVDAIPASTDGLIVQFDFEEEVADPNVASSVTYDGVNYAIATVVDTPVLGVAGKTGLAIDMAGAGHVTIDDSATVLASLADEITVSLWCYGNITDLTGVELYKARAFRAYTATSTIALDSVLPDATGRVIFGSGAMGGSWMVWDDATPADWTGAWNHYAFVIDAASNFQAIYCNGVMVALENDDVTEYAFDLAGLDRFDIGMTPAYHGKIDDFRIYNRALDAGEIVDLAGLASVVQPIDSNADANDDGKVNLADFAEVSTIWLEMVMWP